MAESNITKMALANALKELIKDRPFSKISVSDICALCRISRKSFYYHFKDKYDLMNWIYYTEFIAIADQREYTSGWDWLNDLCAYFYENREFYQRTFNVIGQNSFSEYFRNIVAMIMNDLMEGIYDKNDPIDFYVGFYTDAFYCAIKKWMLGKDSMSADTFVQRLKDCILGTSTKMVQTLVDTKHPET